MKLDAKNFTLVVFFSLQFANALPSKYTVYKTNEPILLDGKANEPIWSKVDSTARVTFFTSENPGPDSLKNRGGATVKMLWDTVNLYLFISVKEKKLWNRIKGRDVWGLWLEKTIEFFIDDSGDNKDFVEMNFAANNSITDIYQPQPYYAFAGDTTRLPGSPTKDACVKDYNADIRMGVDLVNTTLCNGFSTDSLCNQDIDSLFNLEIAIDLASLQRFGPNQVNVLGNNFHVPPHNRDSLKANLYYTGVNPSPVKSMQRDFFGWSLDAGVDFHKTSAYGTLVFVDTLAPGKGNSIAVRAPGKNLSHQGQRRAKTDAAKKTNDSHLGSRSSNLQLRRKSIGEELWDFMGRSR